MRYPATKLKEAREKREEYRKMVSQSIDPSEEKQKSETDEKRVFRNISMQCLKQNSADWGNSTIDSNTRYI